MSNFLQVLRRSVLRHDPSSFHIHGSIYTRGLMVALGTLVPPSKTPDQSNHDIPASVFQHPTPFYIHVLYLFCHLYTHIIGMNHNGRIYLYILLNNVHHASVCPCVRDDQKGL